MKNKIEMTGCVIWRGRKDSKVREGDAHCPWPAGWWAALQR